MEKKRKPENGVFDDLCDNRAFVDKAQFSILGNISDSVREELRKYRNTGILRQNLSQLYSRRTDGQWRVTRNPTTILSGRTVRFANVPDLRVTMRSDAIPVTGAQVILFLKRALADTSEVKVTSIELTFDLTGTSVDYIRHHILHRARRERRLQDEEGRKTFYVGSSTSAWQARIYDKTTRATRLEFIFRRSFLTRHGITRPEDVLLLRRLDIWRCLSLRRFSRSGASLDTKDCTPNLRSVIRDWQKKSGRVQTLAKFLTEHGLDANTVLPKSSLQHKLERMHRRIVW